MVLFLDPHSRKDVKVMRQRYSPNSNKSSRRLYSQALKLRKHCSHLFSGKRHRNRTLQEKNKPSCEEGHAPCFILAPGVFLARIDLQPGSHAWYESLKDKIRHQQTKPVWVSEVTVRHTQQHRRRRRSSSLWGFLLMTSYSVVSYLFQLKLVFIITGLVARW